MIGRTISHYHILEKLGEGGMGVVYKAEDTRLKRAVALKFLPPDSSPPVEEVARFQQEAEAVSALNHPNIATLYDIGEDDGKKFLALEYIPGGTLKQKVREMAREGKQFSVAEATSYILQAAEGLAHAHSHQIVHRDIKSDNLMLTADGRVKITDFGLAKLRGTNQLTKAGSTVGTLAYMAPEQMRGEDVDARADIFSLGVVFHELLAGRTPFQGEHDAAIMYSVLNEDPLPITGFRPDVPANVVRVLDRLLMKDPAARYQTMGEFVSDLRGGATPLPGGTPSEGAGPASGATSAPGGSGTVAAGSAVAGPASKSIVVLPFGNLSPDPENGYFSDGLTEEVIADLSNIRSMRVISRTSAMLLKGTTKDLRTIARELGVQYVLSGSVRKAGQSVRVTAQLVDGNTDANLWSEKYTGTLEDIFEMQEKVSRAIVDALEVTLTSDESRKLAERPIADPRAHDLFLRARVEFHRGDPEALKKSIRLLNEGLAIVGENELLFAALGHCHYTFFRWINKTDEQYLVLANDYLAKTFVLNPDSTHGWTLQGKIRASEGDLGAALQSLRRAIDLDPVNTEALLWLAVFNSYAGNLRRSAEAAETLLSVDPLLPINVLIRGVAILYSGKFDETMPWIRRAYEADPGAPLVKWTLGIMQAWTGAVDEAVRTFDELAAEAPGWVYTQHGLFLKHALRNEKEDALKYATDDLALEAKYDMHFALHVAHCFALIGEKERALDFLEHAVRTGMVNHPFLSGCDPFLFSLRGEGRFSEIMEIAKKEMKRISY